MKKISTILSDLLPKIRCLGEEEDGIYRVGRFSVPVEPSTFGNNRFWITEMLEASGVTVIGEYQADGRLYFWGLSPQFIGICPRVDKIPRYRVRSESGRLVFEREEEEA